MTPPQAREAFEAWAYERGHGITRGQFGKDEERYLNNQTQLLWLAWQAALAHRDAQATGSEEKLAEAIDKALVQYGFGDLDRRRMRVELARVALSRSLPGREVDYEAAARQLAGPNDWTLLTNFQRDQWRIQARAIVDAALAQRGEAWTEEALAEAMGRFIREDTRLILDPSKLRDMARIALGPVVAGEEGGGDE